MFKNANNTFVVDNEDNLYFVMDDDNALAASDANYLSVKLNFNNRQANRILSPVVSKNIESGEEITLTLSYDICDLPYDEDEDDEDDFAVASLNRPIALLGKTNNGQDKKETYLKYLRNVLSSKEFDSFINESLKDYAIKTYGKNKFTAEEWLDIFFEVMDNYDIMDEEFGVDFEEELHNYEAYNTKYYLLHCYQTDCGVTCDLVAGSDSVDDLEKIIARNLYGTWYYNSSDWSISDYEENGPVYLDDKLSNYLILEA